MTAFQEFTLDCMRSTARNCGGYAEFETCNDSQVVSYVKVPDIVVFFAMLNDHLVKRPDQVRFEMTPCKEASFYRNKQGVLDRVVKAVLSWAS